MVIVPSSAVRVHGPGRHDGDELDDRAPAPTSQPRASRAAAGRPRPEILASAAALVN